MIFQLFGSTSVVLNNQTTILPVTATVLTIPLVGGIVKTHEEEVFSHSHGASSVSINSAVCSHDIEPALLSR